MEGPFLPEWAKTEPPEGKLRIAVLNSSPGAQDVLFRILKVRREQGWDFEIVTPLKGPKVLQVSGDYEAAEMSNAVVAPYEDKDYGQPHDGAILALGLGRALITCRTRSFELLPYTNKTFLSCQRYTPGTYVAGVSNYMRDPQRWNEGPPLQRINRKAVTEKILEWVKDGSS